METSTISRNVMRRVRIIHAVRPIFSTTAVASLVLIIAVWAIGREVWVAHVIENLQTALMNGSVDRFLVAAFLNTRTIVQVTVLVASAAALYTFMDLVRALRTTNRFA